MSGFAEDLREKLLGVAAHVVVMQRGQSMEGYEEIRRDLLSIPQVTAVTPFILREVIFEGPEKTTGGILRALDQEAAESAYRFERILKSGTDPKLSPTESRGHPGIFVGKGLQEELGCDVGDSVVLISPEGTLTPWGNLPKWKKFEVKGILDSGYWDFDSRIAIISIGAAQKVFEMPGRVTGLELRVQDAYRAYEVRQKIQQSRLGLDYVALDWMQMNRNIMIALGIQKKVMFVILFFIVLVAALLIISILAMMAMEKKRDIAILKAIGARSPQILQIFMYQGLLIGVVGTSLGCVWGMLVSWNLEGIVSWIERILGIQFLPGDVYYVSELTAKVNPIDVGIIVGVTLLISLLASLYPSWRAARLDPVEVLRYE
jgi:lipoprotein-releasing system permease protein